MTPLLTAASLAGHGLHPRGNYEGWLWAASDDKYLEIYGVEHWTHFYTDYGRELQLRFFDWYLKGEGDWKKTQPRVQRQSRRPGKRFEVVGDPGWPHPATRFAKIDLDAEERTLSPEPATEPATIAYDPFGDGSSSDLVVDAWEELADTLERAASTIVDGRGV